MDMIVMVIFVGILGATLGSFAGASIWRLRAEEVQRDKTAKRSYDKAELSRLHSLVERPRGLRDRSRCLHCHHVLRWYDLLPLVSWLSLRGKCRYCKKPIGYFEIMIEVTMAALFVISVWWWPQPLTVPLYILEIALWLAAVVIFTMLFFYDLRWMVLPLKLTISAVAVGIVYAALHLLRAPDTIAAALSLGGGVAILAGLYYVLFVASAGKWVGGGDYKLAFGLALFLGTWHNAFATLFFANLIGCFVVIPGMLSGKLSRTSTVPLGPFLIAGAFTVFFLSSWIATYFEAITGSVL